MRDEKALWLAAARRSIERAAPPPRTCPACRQAVPRVVLLTTIEYQTCPCNYSGTRPPEKGEARQ